MPSIFINNVSVNQVSLLKKIIHTNGIFIGPFQSNLACRVPFLDSKEHNNMNRNRYNL